MEQQQIEICGYDSAHKIRRARMPYHLLKCARNFPNVKKEQCPFDACHLVDPENYENHIKECPAAKSNRCYDVEKKINKHQIKILPIEVNIKIDAEENWDDDEVQQSYNPLENIKDKPVLIPSPIGDSKNNKKKYIRQERLRYNKF